MTRFALGWFDKVEFLKKIIYLTIIKFEFISKLGIKKRKCDIVNV